MLEFVITYCDFQDLAIGSANQGGTQLWDAKGFCSNSCVQLIILCCIAVSTQGTVTSLLLQLDCCFGISLCLCM